MQSGCTFQPACCTASRRYAVRPGRDHDVPQVLAGGGDQPRRSPRGRPRARAGGSARSRRGRRPGDRVSPLAVKERDDACRADARPAERGRRRDPRPRSRTHARHRCGRAPTPTGSDSREHARRAEHVDPAIREHARVDVRTRVEGVLDASGGTTAPRGSRIRLPVPEPSTAPACGEVERVSTGRARRSRRRLRSASGWNAFVRTVEAFGAREDQVAVLGPRRRLARGRQSESADGAAARSARAAKLVQAHQRIETRERRQHGAGDDLPRRHAGRNGGGPGRPRVHHAAAAPASSTTCATARPPRVTSRNGERTSVTSARFATKARVRERQCRDEAGEARRVCREHGGRDRYADQQEPDATSARPCGTLRLALVPVAAQAEPRLPARRTRRGRRRRRRRARGRGATNSSCSHAVAHPAGPAVELLVQPREVVGHVGLDAEVDQRERSGSRRAISSIDACQASTSMSGGGVGGRM